MPIYEYRCVDCGTKMEVVQKFDDPAPICGCGFIMKKMISASNFHLKGSGWYATDYKNSSKPTETTESSGNAGESSGIPSDID